MTILGEIILSVIMIGNTHYVDVGESSDAVIYYESPTIAHMTLPGAPPLIGDMQIKGDGYHVTWKDGPAGDWKIRHANGSFTYIGPDGKDAGTITKIVPGNPEDY